MKNFQIIILIFFIAAAIFGVLVFSGAIPIGKDKTAGGLGTVTVWGTVSQAAIAQAISDFNSANQSFVLKYVQKSSNTFDQDLLEALADGTGPDMIFLPDNLAYHYTNKIYTIPYQSYSLALFKNNFAGAGEVFLNSKGVLALPMSIDPLMLYYNRSILDANGIVYPPATWDDLNNIVPTLTKKNDSNKILNTTVALGDFANINNAKDILSTLFMQAGNPIVSEQDGIFSSSLDSPPIGSYTLPSVLNFYTNFADPNSKSYSWNKSFTNSSSVFSSENSAFYFGFASELQPLVKTNPNQNFFVAPVPQIKGSNFKVTEAHTMGLAILASSKNLSTAFLAASLMAGGDFASQFAADIGVAPARRDLLAVKQTDAYSPIFYSSALYAKSWLDPSPRDTDSIFSGMIDAVLSNNLTVDGAIRDASSKLDLLLIK